MTAEEHSLRNLKRAYENIHAACLALSHIDARDYYWRSAHVLREQLFEEIEKRETLESVRNPDKEGK